jgi:hypothetical protein
MYTMNNDPAIYMGESYYQEDDRLDFTDPLQLRFTENKVYDKNFINAPPAMDDYCDPINMYNRRNATRDIEEYFHGGQQVKDIEVHSSKCECPKCLRPKRRIHQHKAPRIASCHFQRRMEYILIFLFALLVYMLVPGLHRPQASPGTQPAQYVQPAPPIQEVQASPA